MKVKFSFRDKFLYILVILVLVGLWLILLHNSRGTVNQQAWIKITKNNLTRDGKPFRFIGASAVNLVFYDDWGLDIDKAIRQAKENNISVLRVYMDWGWSKGEDFDKIIDEARRNGVYVILALTDCCCSSDYSSLEKYFQVRAPFCNIKNKQSVMAFKRRIRKIIERRNSINGLIYRDDPTILAWELANELEYWNFDYSDVRKWVSEIANFVKSLDKNHLVTISISTDLTEFDTDTPLYGIFDVPGIDFFSFHFYPQVKVSDSGEVIFQNDYERKIKFRIEKFLSMNKPVVMGEFGFSNSTDLNYRTKNNQETYNLYNTVFKKAMDSAFFTGASGVMFWGWGLPEETNIPMWWRKESHSIADEKFCILIRGYKVPLEADARH